MRGLMQEIHSSRNSVGYMSVRHNNLCHSQLDLSVSQSYALCLKVQHYSALHNFCLKTTLIQRDLDSSAESLDRGLRQG